VLWLVVDTFAPARPILLGNDDVLERQGYIGLMWPSVTLFANIP
jgi:hypothetical protein